MLASVFTDYLLPWNQRAFWAATISTAMLAIALMAFHFWRDRKAGGVIEPRPQANDEGVEDGKVLFFPDLLVRKVSPGAGCCPRGATGSLTGGGRLRDTTLDRQR